MGNLTLELKFLSRTQVFFVIWVSEVVFICSFKLSYVHLQYIAFYIFLKQGDNYKEKKKKHLNFILRVIFLDFRGVKKGQNFCTTASHLEHSQALCSPIVVLSKSIKMLSKIPLSNFGPCGRDIVQLFCNSPI